MSNELSGKRIAILVADGFEQVEMTEPRKALDDAGAKTEIVSPMHGEVQGWNHHEKGKKFHVDVELNSADPHNYDALLLPGGVVNPDQLRTIPLAVQFVRIFVDDLKPIAAICHGPWMLVEADVVRGRTVTSWPSVKDGPAECRRKLGGRGSSSRQRHSHQPQARRYSDVQSENDRGVSCTSAHARTGGRAQPAGRVSERLTVGWLR